MHFEKGTNYDGGFHQGGRGTTMKVLYINLTGFELKTGLKITGTMIECALNSY